MSVMDRYHHDDFEENEQAAARRHLHLVLAALAALALLLLVLVAAPYAQAAEQTAALEPEEIAEVDRASGYLNSIEHMQGAFLQVNPDGTLSEGQFYLRRPGRMRFEYAAPEELLVVSDGSWVIVKESESAAGDRYPLGATPLSILLADDVDLRGKAEVRRVEEEGGILRVTLADSTGEAPGEITLVFDGRDMHLRQWVVTDAQGLQTTVALRNVEYGIRAENELFTVRGETRPVIGGGR
ncbi:LolA family protein [Tepidicaulis sp. LMO-SS28]|uniref:LolA family protein n=1 Tax=Tepidicaulis sp. LMO-SS28 TaxID=3447455 RepID=UPI003EE2C9BA